MPAEATNSKIDSIDKLAKRIRRVGANIAARFAPDGQIPRAGQIRRGDDGEFILKREKNGQIFGGHGAAEINELVRQAETDGALSAPHLAGLRRELHRRLPWIGDHMRFVVGLCDWLEGEGYSVMGVAQDPYARLADALVVV